MAVLDPRLATNARYRWDIVRALPPMRRTRDRAEAEAFLADITARPAPTRTASDDSPARLRDHDREDEDDDLIAEGVDDRRTTDA